jgi:hypothetical protein
MGLYVQHSMLISVHDRLRVKVQDTIAGYGYVSVTVLLLLNSEIPRFGCFGVVFLLFEFLFY